GFVHLAEHHGHLREHSRVLHFVPEVVAFAGAFAYACEYGIATGFASDVRNQLLDDDRLANAGPAVQADLTTADERGDQVDDLDAGLEDGRSRLLLFERRRLAVDAPAG